MEPRQELVKEADRVLALKCLDQDVAVYLEWKKDMTAYKKKRSEQGKLKARLEELLSQNVEQWKKTGRPFKPCVTRKRRFLTSFREDPTSWSMTGSRRRKIWWP